MDIKQFLHSLTIEGAREQVWQRISASISELPSMLQIETEENIGHYLKRFRTSDLRWMIRAYDKMEPSRRTKFTTSLPLFLERFGTQHYDYNIVEGLPIRSRLQLAETFVKFSQELK